MESPTRGGFGSEAGSQAQSVGVGNEQKRERAKSCEFRVESCLSVFVCVLARGWTDRGASSAFLLAERETNTFFAAAASCRANSFSHFKLFGQAEFSQTARQLGAQSSQQAV